MVYIAQYVVQSQTNKNEKKKNKSPDRPLTMLTQKNKVDGELIILIVYTARQ